MQYGVERILTKNRQVGDIDVLKNLLPPTRRLIQEDKGKFETELCEKIKVGEYLKLELCPQPEAGKNQQNKIKCL